MKLCEAVLLIALASVFGGCVVTQEVYIDNASVTSSVNSPPVNLTSDSSAGYVRLSPHLSVNRDRTVNAVVNPDISFNHSAQLRWNVPDYAFGIAGDVGMGPATSFSAGMDWTSSQGAGLMSGFVGIGFRHYNGTTGFRFDAGVLVSNRRYDAYTVVITNISSIFGSSSSDTTYFHDRGESTSLDFYATLTINGRISESPVNLFFNAGLLRQTLLNYSPLTASELHPFLVTGNTADFTYRVTLFSVTPGIGVDVGSGVRVLLGWRVIIPVSEDFHPGTLGMPFMQADFTF